jgi:enoyl-CoA hydratase/carnithine racemase
MLELSRDGDIHIITMNNGPNLIDPEFVAAMHAMLDEVEAESTGAAGLVLTGQDKFFNNGLNVEVIMSLEGESMVSFGTGMSRLVGRLLIWPAPCVAAVNGHAFAAGAVLALASDYRVMREDRGWICLSEVDAGVPIGAPMMNLVRAKLPAAAARDAVLAGKRFAADEAIAAGVADGKASQNDLLAEATKRASELAGKERGIFKTLKKTLWYGEAKGLGALL